MLAEILEIIRIKTEQLEFAGKKIVVRELPISQDLGLAIKTDEDLKRLEDEMVYRLAVRTVFFDASEGELAGKPVFTDDDIEALQAGSKTALLPLFAVVRRVNGLDGDANAKK